MLAPVRLQLTNHGELQEAMISLADQVTVLDDKYRTLSMQKRQFKVRWLLALDLQYFMQH